MTAVVDGPAWSARGLVQHDSRYPLKVESAVQRAVTLLLPGVSTASEFVRYFALYAALAAHAEDRSLDGEACRTRIRLLLIKRQKLAAYTANEYRNLTVRRPPP